MAQPEPHENKKIGPRGQIFIDDCDHIDCAIHSKSGIYGKTWRVSVSLSGPLDDNCFVYDFSDFKKLTKSVLKQTVDHTLVSPSEIVRFKGSRWHFPSGWEYEAPPEAISSIPGEMVSKEGIESFLKNRLQEEFSDSYVIDVILNEESYSPNQFSYTHGITGHKGNCQRTLHGHTGRIEIFLDGKRRPDLEKTVLSNIGSSIHFASEDQVTNLSDTWVNLSYRGTQGLFQTKLPRKNVMILSSGTSIECITSELAHYLESSITLQGHLEFRCFEGFGKGAAVTKLLL